MTQCKNIDVNEPQDYEDPSLPLKENLKLMMSLLSLVDNPSESVSASQIFELLFDFALWLQEKSCKQDRNSEVFEDPLNRGDALGNVLMIHRKVPSWENECLKILSNRLLELTDQVQHYYLDSHQAQTTSNELDCQFGEADLVITSQDLALRKHLALVRKESGKTERRLDNAHSKIWRLDRKLKEKSFVLSSLYRDSFSLRKRIRDLKFQFRNTSDSSPESPGNATTLAFMVSDDVDANDSKQDISKSSSSQDSQVDGISW